MRARCGVEGGVEELPSAPELVTAQRGGYLTALAGLHEQVGRPVAVSVCGGVRGLRLLYDGVLERGYELGRHESSAVCFDVGELTLVLWPGDVRWAWREEYRLGGRLFRVVALELACGPLVEVEERHDSGAERG